MLNLRSVYSPLVLPKMLDNQLQSISNQTVSPTNLKQTMPADSLVSRRSGAGFESRVLEALKAFKKSYSTESAQALQTHTQAWLKVLKSTLASVVNDSHQKECVERSIRTATKHLETAASFIEE